MWNKITGIVKGEKARVKKQNSKKGSEKNEHACSVEGVSSSTRHCSYLMLAGQTLTNQSLPKL